jgi:hypothetical protein
MQTTLCLLSLSRNMKHGHVTVSRRQQTEAERAVSVLSSTDLLAHSPRLTHLVQRVGTRRGAWDPGGCADAARSWAGGQHEVVGVTGAEVAAIEE